MATQKTVYASAPSIERLIKLINQFYYSSNSRVEDGKVFNLKGEINGVEVVKAPGKREKYWFRSTN